MASMWTVALLLAASVAVALAQVDSKIAAQKPMIAAIRQPIRRFYPFCNHQKVVVRANNRFALDLYKNIRCSEDGNMIFSPFSVSAALAMTYGGASGVTATQMAKALRFSYMPSYCDVHKGFLALMNLLQSSSSQYILSTANRIFVDQGFPLKSTFEDLTDTYYLSQAENLDIQNDPANSLDHINDWVASQTNNEITNLLADLHPKTALVLVNAITFKGEWVKKFDVTYSGPFHLTCCDTIQTTKMKFGCGYPMMKHGFIPAFDAQILELPYKGNKVSMYILRPNHIEGLAYLENQLNLATLNNAINSMNAKPIDLALPKFSLSQTIDLKPILKALGMFDVFSVVDADLHKIGTSNAKLWVDFVVHQAIINVHENGTEASAATAVGVCRMKRTAPPPIPYDVDRPFIFFIREQTSGSILFMGRLVKPEAAAATAGGVGKVGEEEFAKFVGAKPDQVFRRG